MGTRPYNIRLPPPVRLTLEGAVSEPNTPALLGLKVGAPDAPEKFISLPSRGISPVMVWLAENAEFMTTLSWGKGTLVVQAFALQLPPLVPLQVWVADVVNVILVLPPASPDLPVMAEAS
jgi:hypothetical protein